MGQPVWWRENGFGEGGTAEFLRLRPNIPPFISTLGMVFISDGNSGIGAHVQREIGYSMLSFFAFLYIDSSVIFFIISTNFPLLVVTGSNELV